MLDPLYEPVPQPAEVTRKERDDAMGGYLMMFAALAIGLPLPIINLLATVIYYFVNRRISRFVHFHTLQSLLSQIPTSLLNSGLVFWTIRNLFGHNNFSDAYFGYLLAVVVANLVYFIISIVAAVRAYNGRMFYMLFFGKIAYHYAYRSGNNTEAAAPVNRPPSF